jgi:hypothetical protein
MGNVLKLLKPEDHENLLYGQDYGQSGEKTVVNITQYRIPGVYMIPNMGRFCQGNYIV